MRQKTGRHYWTNRRDGARKAKRPGKRISTNGNAYWESRPNRADWGSKQAGKKRVAGKTKYTVSNRKGQKKRVRRYSAPFFF